MMEALGCREVPGLLGQVETAGVFLKGMDTIAISPRIPSIDMKRISVYFTALRGALSRIW